MATTSSSAIISDARPSANERAHFELDKLLHEKTALKILQHEISEQIRLVKHEQQYAREILDQITTSSPKENENDADDQNNSFMDAEAEI